MRAWACRFQQGDRRRRSASAILSALPILAADLFVEFVRGKNRIQNEREHHYPAHCRKDRED
jgi:hypothetical protein